ncbi:hypothetical protein GO491_03015 [Flavobacteriaceae bacterium Ap0902]|nr:hypothetical protein [Flavobacteriaceae bacterium Ap0902]
MRKYSILLTTIILFSCSEYKGEKDSLSYDEIEITFDGYGDYDTEGKLKTTISNPVQIKKLNQLKNQSKINWLPNLKATEYVIRLIFVNNSTNEKLLLRILKSTDYHATIEYGPGTIFDGKYRNDELVNYISSLIKLDAIKRYKGSLSQEEYDTFN